VSTLVNSNSFCSNYIDQESIETLVSDHVNLKRDNHKKLWILLNLELWHNRFVVAK
jgi:hypothetical protein